LCATFKVAKLAQTTALQCAVHTRLLLLHALRVRVQGVALIAPWEESSPLLKFISENFSHQAADMVLEGQELLVNIIQ
jgi:hypothetical protein